MQIWYKYYIPYLQYTIFAYMHFVQYANMPGIPEEQLERINDELESQQTLLNDNCRMKHYTQEGVEQLLFQIESAENL